MPEVDINVFGRHDRTDGKPGHQEITPTEMNIDRVRVYGPDGLLEETYFRDTIGVRFTDIPEVKDDPSYLEKISGSKEVR